MADIAIALDLGGTQLRAALVNRAGQVLQRWSEPTAARAGPDVVIPQMARLAHVAMDAAGSTAFSPIGVSSPGPLDTEKGLALGLPTIDGFADVPLAALLEQATGRKILLENDGIAAALGEWRQGAGKGLDHLVYVTVSTGIGGGVVSDGRLLRGRRGMACHVGHMIIDPEGPVCGCGNPGCWEAFGAGPAFTRRANERLAMRLSADSPGFTAKDVFDAARGGDAVAKALVAEEAHILGVGIVALLHLYSPQKVILGGGMMKDFDLMEAGIQAEIARRAMPAFRDTRIEIAALGGDAGLIGAAELVFAPRPQA